MLRKESIERFHHVITIPYTRNKPPSWSQYNLYSTLLAVYAISIKNPQVSVYIAVVTYVAMVFCPIQHILALISWRSPWKLLSCCTPTWRLFSVFLHINLKGDDITWKGSTHLISNYSGLHQFVATVSVLIPIQCDDIYIYSERSGAADTWSLRTYSTDKVWLSSISSLVRGVLKFFMNRATPFV